MTKINIIHFFALLAILYFVFFMSSCIKDHFGVSLPQKTKQCSKDDINNAYKEYIFTGPKQIVRG